MAANKIWNGCPKCGYIHPPKGFVCAKCKQHFDGNFNPIGSSPNKEPPSMHMGSHDESPEYM